MSKIVAALGRLFPFFSENSSNNTQNQRKIKDFPNNEIFSFMQSCIPVLRIQCVYRSTAFSWSV